MSTIRVELHPDLAQGQPGRERCWFEEVAEGETLGRLLARILVERPGFAGFFDPASRRLATGVHLAVNGRAYHLIGGLTYTLHPGDRLDLSPA